MVESQKNTAFLFNKPKYETIYMFFVLCVDIWFILAYLKDKQLDSH